MIRKNIVLFFEYFDSQHFCKDPFLVPYYLGKIMDYNVKILYPESHEGKHLPQAYKGVQLLSFPIHGDDKMAFRTYYADIFQYVEEHALEIDVLMLFFGEGLAMQMLQAYKQANPAGKVYIKMDRDPYDLLCRSAMPLWQRTWHWLKCAFGKMPPLWQADVVSCETRLLCREVAENCAPSRWYEGRLTYMPNGIDEEEVRALGFGSLLPDAKENIILTVGRLGTYEKDTELLLDALERIDLKDWKVYLVGPIEQDFEPVRRRYMERHPEWQDRVIWTGPLTNRSELYRMYSRSRVFVLPSRWESYGIVLTEAQRFGNYLISTPVGAIHDVIGGGKYGEVVGQGDADSLARALNNVVTGRTRTDVYADFDYTQLSWSHVLGEVASLLSSSQQGGTRHG